MKKYKIQYYTDDIEEVYEKIMCDVNKINALQKFYAKFPSATIKVIIYQENGQFMRSMVYGGKGFWPTKSIKQKKTNKNT